MNNLKETNFKNCSCDYFDDLIKNEYFDFDKILIMQKYFGLWQFRQRFWFV